MSATHQDNASSTGGGSPPAPSPDSLLSPKHGPRADEEAEKSTKAQTKRLYLYRRLQDRGDQLKQNTETRQFVTAVNREVRVIREHKKRSDAARIREQRARWHRQHMAEESHVTLNEVEHKLQLAPTLPNGKAFGMHPLTTYNGAIGAGSSSGHLQSTRGTSPHPDEHEGKLHVTSPPPRPLLQLSDTSVHIPVYTPTCHLVATPRRSAYFPPIGPAPGSPKKEPQNATMESTVEQRKRDLLMAAARRALSVR
jgi:hypothetical protein